MNRCSRLSPRLHILAGLLAFGCLPLAAMAQTLPVRQFPPQALRGKLVVTQPPLITIDGKATQLSPGARIKGTNNLLVMSASLVGQELTVNYITEPFGQVHEVWILNAAEAAEKRKRAGE